MAVGAVGLVVALVGGCGGDDGEGAPTAPSEQPTGLPTEFTAFEVLGTTDDGLVFSALTYPDDAADPVPVWFRSDDGTDWEALDESPVEEVLSGAVWAPAGGDDDIAVVGANGELVPLEDTPVADDTVAVDEQGQYVGFDLIEPDGSTDDAVALSFISDDGVLWTGVADPDLVAALDQPNTDLLPALAAENGRFYAAAAGQAWRSDDGQAWEPFVTFGDPEAPDEVLAAAVEDDELVLLARRGEAWTVWRLPVSD